MNAHCHHWVQCTYKGVDHARSDGGGEASRTALRRSMGATKDAWASVN